MCSKTVESVPHLELRLLRNDRVGHDVGVPETEPEKEVYDGEEVYGGLAVGPNVEVQEDHR
jgi:hypothetical protein